MSLEDRYVTPTPEGVSLDVALAGFGSRFSAFLLDFIFQVIVFVIYVVALYGSFDPNNANSSVILVGLQLLGSVLIFLGYFILFETLWSGRTLGKRLMGIRVVKTSGAAAGFIPILLRNVARLIDSLPGLYLVGSICILASANNQRLGDMLASTIVIREHHAADRIQSRAIVPVAQAWVTPIVGSAPGLRARAPLSEHLTSWDVSQVSDAEVALVRQFLTRRWEYTPTARDRLAAQLRGRIASRVAGDHEHMLDEVFLESVSQVKAARR